MVVQAVQAPEGNRIEQPVLWLGMAGFAPAQRKSLADSVGRATGLCQWRSSSFADADGWWVNGARCSVGDDNRLKVAPGLPSERALRLELKEINRPLAFAQPLAQANLEALCVFDPTCDDGVHGALIQFEKWLLPLRTRFALGAMLLRRDSQQRRGIYHLTHRAMLVAVLDFAHGTAAVSARAHPAHVWDGQWERRPAAAGQTPAGFASCTITQLACGYVRRTERDMLPARYRTEVVYYRRAPRVPMRWLRDSQLLLLRELSAEPGTLQALADRTSLSVEQLAHDLACLYYAGSVTTTPETAAGESINSYEVWPESAAAEQRPRQDLTAPALLERRPKPPPQPRITFDPLTS